MMSRLLPLLAILLLLPVAQAQKVEEVSSFKVFVDLNSKAHVRYDVTLKNLIDKPVVPGVGEIRLQKVEPLKLATIPIPFTEQKKPVQIENPKAYSGNRNFKVSVENFEDYTALFYEIWYPIPPYETMSFTIEFDADIVDNGILFKSITIPIGADTDIRNLEIFVNSVSSWKLSYAEPAMKDNRWVGSLPAGSISFYTAEFSVLPLPLMPLRGYLVFWGAVIALMILLGLLMRK